MLVRILLLLITAIISATTGLTGGPLAAAAHPTDPAGPAQVSIIVHSTRLAFVTAQGVTTPFPTGPLAPGDRVLGQDDLLQAGRVVGSDDEVCTVDFQLHVLCDDMLSFVGRGDLHATWIVDWPASGAAGPSTFDGVVDGGTGAYRGASGDFHATVESDHDVLIAAAIRY
jgi:hypothetical protein